MENLALFSRLTSFSLPCSARHPLIGFSQRRLFASSSTAASAEKEELARFTYAVKTGSNLIPLYRCIFCDHLTPILAYRCLVEEDQFEAPSFLFESVEHGFSGASVGRYSVLGAHPGMEIVSKENVVSIVDHELGRRTEEVVDDPMGLAWRMMEGWSPHFLDELPDVFCGIF
ncbi:hypothetical protein KSP40_PGU002856 [Platanthera guangdongensis]|uniref:Anthranilate synthase component I N-terminal domain-containing protein n=1 Tax=Platanthera guangdongensis TaxID=2320717 RepID=A0ABR2N1G2_9ASPA